MAWDIIRTQRNDKATSLGRGLAGGLGGYVAQSAANKARDDEMRKLEEEIKFHRQSVAASVYGSDQDTQGKIAKALADRDKEREEKEIAAQDKMVENELENLRNHYKLNPGDIPDALEGKPLTDEVLIALSGNEGLREAYYRQRSRSTPEVVELWDEGLRKADAANAISLSRPMDLIMGYIEKGNFEEARNLLEGFYAELDRLDNDLEMRAYEPQYSLSHKSLRDHYRNTLSEFRARADHARSYAMQELGKIGEKALPGAVEQDQGGTLSASNQVAPAEPQPALAQGDFPPPGWVPPGLGGIGMGVANAAPAPEQPAVPDIGMRYNAPRPTPSGATGYEYMRVVDMVAQESGLPPQIMRRILQHESAGDPTAVSPVNPDGSRDYGLFQINSSNFPGLEAQGINVDNILDPEENARAAAIIIKDAISAIQKMGLPETDENIYRYYNGGMSGLKGGNNAVENNLQRFNGGGSAMYGPNIHDLFA